MMDHIGPAITEKLRHYVEEFNALVVLPTFREFEKMQVDLIAGLLQEIDAGTARHSLRTFADNVVLLERTRARIEAHYEVIEKALADGF